LLKPVKGEIDSVPVRRRFVGNQMFAAKRNRRRRIKPARTKSACTDLSRKKIKKSIPKISKLDANVQLNLKLDASSTSHNSLRWS
jgi:hypothetical protein